MGHRTNNKLKVEAVVTCFNVSSRQSVSNSVENCSKISRIKDWATADTQMCFVSDSVSNSGTPTNSP